VNLAPASLTEPNESRLPITGPLSTEDFHDEAKTWHGLARAVRRGLNDTNIQS